MSAESAELNDRQSLASITLQAESFLAAQAYSSPYPARFKLSRLDSRLNLKPCTQSLDIKFTRAEKVIGNSSLTIRCQSPVSWQIHLPVRVDLYDDIAVNKSPLIKGQSINSSQIIYQKKKVSNLQQGYYRKSDPVERLKVKRNLASGTILTTANLEPKLMVTSGQKVTILLSIDGLQIKSSGFALQSARQGQIIKVKNTQSDKIIEGVVLSEGVVNVRL
ncbi:MAG: flagellar basal body P-ring formation protein FlgA [Gammaproteobacteria bacterium]|nr:flagellar basal body P-ring formation protein FlgA [Gammaproteobacteria bacterium]